MTFYDKETDSKLCAMIFRSEKDFKEWVKMVKEHRPVSEQPDGSVFLKTDTNVPSSMESQPSERPGSGKEQSEVPDLI